MTRPSAHEVFPFCSRSSLSLLLLEFLRSRKRRR